MKERIKYIRHLLNESNSLEPQERIPFSDKNEENIRQMIVACNFWKTQDADKDVERAEVAIGDIHGDINQLMINLIRSGVARFKDNEPSTRVYDIKAKQFVDLNGIMNFMSAEEFEKGYRIVPNIEFNKDCKNDVICLGDVLDRGRHSDECFITLYELMKEEKRQLANASGGTQQKTKLHFVAGDHELYGLKNTLNIELSPCYFVKDPKVLEQWYIDIYKQDHDGDISEDIIFEIESHVSSCGVCQVSNREASANDMLSIFHEAFTDGTIEMTYLSPSSGVVYSHSFYSQGYISKIIDAADKLPDVNILRMSKEQKTALQAFSKFIDSSDPQIKDGSADTEEYYEIQRVAFEYLNKLNTELAKRTDNLSQEEIKLLDAFTSREGPLWNRGSGKIIHLKQAIGHTDQGDHKVSSIYDCWDKEGSKGNGGFEFAKQDDIPRHCYIFDIQSCSWYRGGEPDQYHTPRFTYIDSNGRVQALRITQEKSLFDMAKAATIKRSDITYEAQTRDDIGTIPTKLNLTDELEFLMDAVRSSNIINEDDKKTLTDIKVLNYENEDEVYKTLTEMQEKYQSHKSEMIMLVKFWNLISLNLSFQDTCEQVTKVENLEERFTSFTDKFQASKKHHTTQVRE